ncbi:MAG TPA: hypothetical protein VM509_05075 [Planctomycetota bacterium]|nr:hypothetical protein [Planctomycetota bacterium]
MKWGVVLLFVLALAQMAGDVFSIAWLKGVAAATAASPAPKVFSAVRGLETYSTRFAIRWTDKDGEQRSLALTPESCALLRGPYNRRNVYGAVLAYGPLLSSDPRTRPMLEAVLRAALCPPAPLLAELGIDTAGISRVVVVYEPLRADALGHLPTRIEAPCP